MVGERLTAADIERAMNAVWNAPRRIHQHVIHPRYAYWRIVPLDEHDALVRCVEFGCPFLGVIPMKATW